ncbi:hypothetical protein DEO72_LG3g853 [Vigna unguiculata]|uniref:Uncharacterized protein n=1 Tax=Vigna unguiculata TaxID=3917 RepID=A0A4D6LCK9_VIGUN|nr:hypothetical protein DEO72_LG3g853 [Vigna unguiculata]
MENNFELPVTTISLFFPDQLNPTTPKITRNRAQQTRIAWREFITVRQFISETQKRCKTSRSAWRPGVCRQAVPRPGTQITYNYMHRLAVMNSPPGDFWKFSRKHKASTRNEQ